MINKHKYTALITLAILFSFVRPALSAEDFRLRWSRGETREYRLKMGSAEIGREFATYIGTQNFPEVGTVYEFSIASHLDLSPVGQDTELQYTSKIAYMPGGVPVQYEAIYVEQGDTSRIRLSIRGNEVKGAYYSEYGDSSVYISVVPGTFICDRNFTAHWDIVFGVVDPPPGDTIKMNVLIPRITRRHQLPAISVGTESIVYAGETVECAVKSVPMVNQRFYIGPDGNLLKVVDPRRSLIIDLIPPGEETLQPERGFFSTIHRRLLIWFCYLVWVVMVLFFFIRYEIRRPLIWIIFAVAGALFGFVFLVQAPIQQKSAQAIFRALGSTGSGAYIVALISSLISGLIQESLKLAPMWLFWYLLTRKPRLEDSTILGAAAGAGFGFVEACWITGGAFALGALSLLSMTVLDRMTAIVFHTMTGLILGYGLGRRKILPYWLIAVVVHMIAKFMLVFLSTGAIDIYFYQFFLLIYYAVIFYFVYKLMKYIRLR